MRLLLASLLLLVPLHAALADDAGTVLVGTETPKRGSVPEMVTAYGTAAPALDGGMTLSLQQDGQVLGIAVTPGETVRAGEKLIDFGASAAATSAYAQAETALALTRSERAHTAQLLGQQLATRDQLAQADKAVADAQATLDAMKREGAGRPLRALTAPFDGIVSAIPVAQGDRVASGAPLLTLTRLDGLVVTVGVEPAVRSRLRPGQGVVLQRLSGGDPLAGQLVRVDGVLNPRTRMVDADVSAPAGQMISGEAFEAAITVGEVSGWLVPHDAVAADDSGAYVFQVDAGHAVRVAARITGSSGQTDVLDAPLDAGRKLVVQGALQLTDGDAVREAP